MRSNASEKRRKNRKNIDVKLQEISEDKNKATSDCGNLDEKGEVHKTCHWRWGRL